MTTLSEAVTWTNAVLVSFLFILRPIIQCPLTSSAVPLFSFNFRCITFKTLGVFLDIIDPVMIISAMTTKTDAFM